MADVTDTSRSGERDLTAASPATFTVTTASSQALATNAARRGLIIVNTGTLRVSLGLGVAAVLDSGITLYPQGSYEMDRDSFDTAAINAIAPTGGSTLGIQEWT